MGLLHVAQAGMMEADTAAAGQAVRPRRPLQLARPALRPVLVIVAAACIWAIPGGAFTALSQQPSLSRGLGGARGAPAQHLERGQEELLPSSAEGSATVAIASAFVVASAATGYSAVKGMLHRRQLFMSASLSTAAESISQVGAFCGSLPIVTTFRASKMPRHAEKTEPNYLALLFKGDLPKRIATILLLLAAARIGFYIPLYGFDVDATAEYFGRQAQGGGIGFIDQLFGGGLGRVSLFSLGIGPYITSSIIFQILTTITPSLKSLAQGEEGEAGRERYKTLIKQVSFFVALLQGVGQANTLAPFVFDNGPVFIAQITIQLALGAMATVFIADKLTEQKLGNGGSLLVFSSIVANLPRTIAGTIARAGVEENGYGPVSIYCGALLITILGLVFVLQTERRIPILFAKRLQEEARGGSTDDAGQSYLPIKLNASGVLPIIFAGSLMSLPALAANYTRLPWLQPIAKSLLPGADAYIPVSMVLIALFSYVSTFQVLDPKDMSVNLRKQAAAIPSVRPGRETEEYLRDVLSRASIFGAIILALLFVLPNAVEALTKLSAANSFGGTSLLILVGVAADTWRQLQAELLMQQYATDVDKFYKGAKK